MTRRFVEVSTNDHIATVRLNRPESLNAISGAMADELTAAFSDVSDDRDVWVVVLAAAGDKAFCVGADLKERNAFSLEQFYDNRVQIKGMFRALRSIPQPVIAAVFGYALGGGMELALSCDLIVAAEGTKLGLPEARVGLLPAGGGTQLLTRKLGVARAKDMIYRGRRVDAAVLHDWGLVTEVTAPERLDEAAEELAKDVLKSSPVALRAAKRSIDGALGVPVEDGIEIEHGSWESVISSEDRQEGIEAFNAKRDPRWKNR
jgi:enoyl-CoA hydratase/carnithine racemase